MKYFLIFELLASTPCFSSYSPLPYNRSTSLAANSYFSDISLANRGFVKNNPIIKSYGPLILDINNVQFDDGIFFIPALNFDSKPFFLAIKCSEFKFNIRLIDRWKGWFKPFFSYELKVFNDFCRI
tara:strand:- start:5 stop:382 length:378 start_codon:yes stop_codon:yes gene_type:complete